MNRPLDFHFDFISPFGYFASLRIEALAARHGRTVNWHAMLLGVSVMKVMGLKPLLDTPLKGPYTEHDVQRYAREHGLVMARKPSDAAMNPLPCARAFAWVKQHHPTHAAALAHAIYRAYWGEGQDLSKPEALRGLALPPGLSADAVADAAAGEEAAALLRAMVDASLKAGVFGSPTVVVDGEMFWGVDKLDQLERWLTRGGW
ncbi:MAG: 2-hydroxychromene-2-carboxylate isomerase [Hydrogenophaga sp.]|jgi:2-hydroxychromene-2-carboxylate isomerase|uniref:2-hydroxychromene-2-carboxylate isomerase n=1 Tax=Hydrogenophaga sp. TaxID=1904254 RepID=UPI001DF08A26|nr:2-hydroxychromene-2-carboxylate isomerase [Hydrogenophaga sp.]MBW0172750.1 2-hydroxychromene-2-carboxylate isomerase [Hydrogenophaga sp.]MBW0184112.1 2-hydroxychromene-2-carboxylate isomerase [Hydrogenophaga sp.]